MQLRGLSFCLAAALAVPAAADTLDQDLAIARGATLRLAIEAADVTLAAGEPGRVAVHVESDGKIGKDLSVEAREEAGGVAIELRLPDSGGWLSGWSGRSPRTKLRLSAPPDIALDLALSGGNLRSSLDVTGAVSARISGGDLELGRTGGRLDAKVSGGNARFGDVGGAADVKASGGDLTLGSVGGALNGAASGGSLRFGAVTGALMVKSSGGDVRGGPVDGSIEGRCSGGSLRLAVKGIGTGAELTSSGGDVVLEIDPAAAFDVDIESSGGDVHAGIPLTVEGKLDEGRISGKVNGGGPRLHARASGGSIRLEPLSSR